MRSSPHVLPLPRALAFALRALPLALLLGWGLAVAADDPSPSAPSPPGPARAVPAPEPAPQAPPARYLNAHEVAARLSELAGQQRPPRQPAVSLTEYGRSAAGQPLLALWMGAPERPTVLVHGGLAFNDAAGSAAVLALAERLLTPEGSAVLEQVSYVLIPAPNPDALTAFLAGRPRAGGIALDRDADGRRGEDGPDDANGDGEVLTLRRRSPRGAWAGASEVQPPGTPAADARLLLERGPDARRATSYEVLAEGLDDDGDGRVNEDAPGMDLTRQLAGWWDAQGPWGGEGAFAGQAPEARALMELSYGLASLVAWYGFRSEGPFLLRASEHGVLADADNPLYDEIASALKARVGVETRRASERAPRGNPGSDLDWAATHLGVVAFALPVWRIAKEPSHGVERPSADEVDWMLWNDRVLGGRGFAAWTPFEHPTLGPVEIGGWRRFTRHEPPAERLSEAVAAVCAAPLAHAAFVPRLRLNVTVEERGGGLFEVRAEALNVGGGPTDTALAEQRQRAMSVRLRLAVEEGVERLAGPASADVGRLGAGAASPELRWTLRRVPPRAGRTPEPLLATLSAEHRVAGRVLEEVRAP